MICNSLTFCQFTFTVFFIYLLKFSGAANDEYGILAAESSTDKENFCIVYFTEFSDLPSQKSKAEFHILQIDIQTDWCDDHPDANVKSKVLLISRNNCSVSTQALHVQNGGGEAVLFLSRSGSGINIDVNNTDAHLVNITVGLISRSSVERLKSMGEPISVQLFSTVPPGFDLSLLVIWFIAMFTISVGAFWSGHKRYTLFCKEMNSVSGVGQQPLPNKPASKVHAEEESSLNVNAYVVGGFVLCMGLMLVLLYFLYDYLVYFIISLFVIASIVSVYSCLEPIVLICKWNFCKVVFRYGSSSYHLDIRQVLLVAFSFAVSVCWVVMRNAKWAWILQDVLGVAFCIHILKTIRLPSFKICTVLLVLLFFYDIFFVFVTPYFTKKGESVMEEVATGGSNSEMVKKFLFNTDEQKSLQKSRGSESIPMLLRVVHIGLEPMSACYRQFSILGFGDILIPGLVISYCHGFDLVTSKRRIYFFTTITTYGLGLFITFGALFLMKTAQPALLYLVPCTLLPPVLLALFRKELPALWKGFKVAKPSDDAACPDVQVAANTSLPETYESATSPDSPKTHVPSAEGTVGHNEEKNLLLH